MGGETADIFEDGKGTFYQIVKECEQEAPIYIVGCDLDRRTEELSITGSDVDFVVRTKNEELTLESNGVVHFLSQREFDRYKDTILDSGLPFGIVPSMEGDLGVYLEKQEQR